MSLSEQEDSAFVPEAEVDISSEEISTAAPTGLFDVVWRVVGLVVLLYLFLVGIGLIGQGFKLLSGAEAGALFQSVSHPITALMIGMLSTALLQSASTTTSIIVGLAASGVLPISGAIPMVMGANIGTSVTNTLVSLGHAGNRKEFGRAFAGATVHDFFNILAVAVLLPMELLFSPLEKLSGWLTTLLAGASGATFESPLAALLKPAESAILQVDKAKIAAAAHGEAVSGSLLEGGIFEGSGLSDGVVGTLVVIGAAVLTIVALLGIVKLMKSMMQTRATTWIKRALHKNDYVSMGLGAGATAVVQSSSVTTSTLVPMVGVGMVSLEAIFPLTLGANIGTTVTALLASMASSGEGAALGLQIALCHLLFNVMGILIWYPIPFMRRIPLGMARWLGEIVAKRRLFALVYVALVFFLIPLGIFALDRAL